MLDVLKMRQTVLPVIVITLASATGFGQSPAPLTFEVASVKPTPPPDPSKGIFFGPPKGGPGTDDPGQITWSGASLMAALTTAYDVKPYQVTGPDWLRMERYEFTVKVPPGTTKEQANVMWQNLLKERFGMAIHKDSKEFQTDELTVAKGGPKLKETDIDPNVPPFQPSEGPPKLGADGTPQLPGPGLIQMIQIGPSGPLGHIVAKAQTLAQLAGMIGNQLGHPVIDKTGLTGKYDFTVEFKPDLNGLPLLPPGAAGPGGPPAGDNASEPGSNIESALQLQLGLRLVKGKAPLVMIVVDHANKTPTEN